MVFVFGAYDWYQSFRPRDYDYSYEKLRKIEATKRVAEKAAISNATIASNTGTANDPMKQHQVMPQLSRGSRLSLRLMGLGDGIGVVR